MIHAIALDDEPPALSLLDFFCKESNEIILEATFTKPREAIKYLQQHKVNLLFLDVEMPSMSGLEFYTKVPVHTHIIFTTAHMRYAVEGFNLNALDFLLKPYSKERLFTAIRKASQAIQLMQASTREEFIHIRADYSLIKIAIADILFIESLGDYVKIHLQNTKPIVARMTMKAVTAMLNPVDFVRVHRSYIVAIKRVSMLKNKTIMVENRLIPISNSYEQDFISRFNGD